MSSVLVTIVNDYMLIGVEKGALRSRRNVKRNLKCLVHVPAIFILITVIIFVYRVRSFISRRTSRERKGREKICKRRGPEYANYYNYIDANFQA